MTRRAGERLELPARRSARGRLDRALVAGSRRPHGTRLARDARLRRCRSLVLGRVADVATHRFAERSTAARERRVARAHGAARRARREQAARPARRAHRAGPHGRFQWGLVRAAAHGAARVRDLRGARSAGAAATALWASRRASPPLRVAIAGGAALLGFVVVRAASFEHFALTEREVAGIPVESFAELAGIATTLVAALWHERLRGG